MQFLNAVPIVHAIATVCAACINYIYIYVLFGTQTLDAC